MKDYIRAILFILAMCGIITVCCVLSHVFRIAEIITLFLTRHIWLAIIIGVLCLMSYIKSVRRKMRD